MKKAIVILVAMQLTTIVLSQDDSVTAKYSYLRGLIESGNITEAQSKIDSWTDLKGDPTLTQLQTDIWTKIADEEFNRKNFRKALLNYEKVSAYWPFNTTIQERIKETKLKINSTPIDFNEIGNIPTSSATSEFISKLQKSGINIIILDEELNSMLKSELKKNLRNEASFNLSQSMNYSFLAILTIVSITNSVLLFKILKSNKKGHNPK
ncbi:MAG: hypothetical protein SFU98_10890 [Leptospiraceae bacterium]|nr:hypothetical protein [Leptospiraceae bacterium]